MLMIVASMLFAQSVSAPPSPAKADREICKETAPTGSRVPRGKVCRTAAEWDKLAAQTSREFAEAQNRSGNNAAGGE